MLAYAILPKMRKMPNGLGLEWFLPLFADDGVSSSCGKQWNTV